MDVGGDAVQLSVLAEGVGCSLQRPRGGARTPAAAEWWHGHAQHVLTLLHAEPPARDACRWRA